MSYVPPIALMLVVTGLILLLFLLGAGLIGYALVTRRRTVTVGTVGATQPRTSALFLAIGAVLLLISLAGCAYSGWLMVAAR